MRDFRYHDAAGLDGYIASICESLGMEKVADFGETEGWKRKLVLYKNTRII